MFYGALLSWSFSPGQMGRDQGGGVTPEVGLWNGARSDGTVAHGAIPGYRVNDVAAVAVRVRSAGGATKDPQERPYGLESDCVDNQGVSFYLHQLLDTPTDDDGDLANGRQHGDVGYMSLGVPELALAEGSMARCWGGPLPLVRMRRADKSAVSPRCQVYGRRTLRVWCWPTGWMTFNQRLHRSAPWGARPVPSKNARMGLPLATASMTRAPYSTCFSCGSDTRMSRMSRTFWTLRTRAPTGRGA